MVETNEERVNRIYGEWNYDDNISNEDVDWLIEQAKKYQKLEDAWKRQQSFGFMKRCSEIID